ncbi:MAG: hypothetical protein HOI66_22260 [Verrucomicrobia bacterium]|nr:hypothetical protein [Verrucomicrobiota bacterium]
MRPFAVTRIGIGSPDFFNGIWILRQIEASAESDFDHFAASRAEEIAPGLGVDWG